MAQHDKRHDDMGQEAAKAWKQFKGWGWTAGASLIGVLTGALGWSWMGSVEKQHIAYDARHETYDAKFYKNENRITIMETELRWLRESRADLEERLRALCRETRKC